MAKAMKIKSEPFIRVVKRDNSSFLFRTIIRVVTIFMAFLISVLFLQGVSGIPMGKILKYIVDGSTITKSSKISFWKDAMLLLAVALALTPAFKMKFWNIGGQGQILMGALMTSVMMYYCSNMASGLVILLSFITAVTAGAIWALIPAVFKIKIGANETLFTLMLNYIAVQIVEMCVDIWKGQASALAPFNSGTKVGWLPSIGKNQYGWVIFTVIVLTALIFVYLKYTKHGYEISVVGESLSTAKYAGMNTSWIILRTVALSGALCGLVGFFYVAGVNHVLSSATSGSYGFTAIVVSWASGFNPFGMFVIAVLMTFLSLGTDNVVNYASQVLNGYTSYITVGVFLFLLIGCEFFINYKMVYSASAREKAPGWFNFWDNAVIKIDSASDKMGAWCKKQIGSLKDKIFKGKVTSIPKEEVKVEEVSNEEVK